jgi:acyl-coenzyme A thioesterase PaaI-like protein
MSKLKQALLSQIFRRPILLKQYLNFYPPWIGAGIRVRRISKDFREIDVALRMRPGNGNAFGTHFGGSLYAMCDPLYVLMFVTTLGEGYLVWDKSARIEFVKPGRGTLTAKFRLSEADIAAAKEATASGAKYLPRFAVEVVDADGNVVARVEKELYIRRRPQRRNAG